MVEYQCCMVHLIEYASEYQAAHGVDDILDRQIAATEAMSSRSSRLLRKIQKELEG